MSARLPILLWGIATALRYTAARHPVFKSRLAEKDLLAQIRTRDGSVGRWYQFKDGRLKSRSGIHPTAEFALTFRTADTGAKLLTPPLERQTGIVQERPTERAGAGPYEGGQSVK